MKFHAAPVPTRTYLWSISDTVTPYLGQYLQLSEDMFRKWLKNRNHYKNKSLNILLLQTSECKQLLLPKIYSSCILPEPTSSNDSSHSLPNPGQPKCVKIISTIEGLAFRPWKQRGNWRPSGQFHFQTPRGSFRGFTAYPRPQTTIITIIIRHVLNITIIYEGKMSGCTNHVESIHSNFVISRNHWSAITVWGDKTNCISQISSLFYHQTSPQYVHPRIRWTDQNASQQHTYHSACRGTEFGEWHLTLPLRKGYCSAEQQDPTYQNWPTMPIPGVKLLNSLPRRKHGRPW